MGQPTVVGVPTDAAGAAVRLARAGLLRLAEPPAPAVVDFVEEVGAVAAFDAVLTRSAPPDVLSATRARTAGRSADELRDLAAVDLEQAAQRSAALLCPEDAAWPAAAIIGFSGARRRGVQGAAPPLAMYVRGRLPEDLPHSAVTMVGSRASTGYGNRVAADLTAGLAAAGFVVVSGGAYGIDTVAHRAALGCAARSVAVLACGIDRAYPAGNAGLLSRVADTGALIGEYPPGTTPAKHRFLVRNRLLAALSSVTVVVEAGRRSGSLSTASAAAHLGRVVLAVPGPITSAMSVGCHLLLRDRFAQLVTSADDVISAARPLASTPVQPAENTRPTDTLDGVALRVHDALPASGSRTVHELSVESGLDAVVVLEMLPILELYALARQRDGRWERC